MRTSSTSSRLLAATALVAALGLTVSACGGGSKDNSGDSGGKSSGGKTLTYWASNQGTSLDNDKAVLTPELKKFEQQTGIKVKLEVIPWSDLLNRILGFNGHLGVYSTAGRLGDYDADAAKKEAEFPYQDDNGALETVYPLRGLTKLEELDLYDNSLKKVKGLEGLVGLKSVAVRSGHFATGTC